MNAQAEHVVDDIADEEMTGQLVRPGDIAPVQLDPKQLAEVNRIRSDIATLATEYAELPDVTTKQGMKVAKERKKHVSGLRTRGQAAVKGYTKPLYDAKKEIDTLWREHILVQLKAIEDPISEAIKAEEEKAARAAAVEAERIRAIQERIATIRSTASTLITIETIDSYLAELQALDLFEAFAEFKSEAIIVISDARRVMNERRDILAQQVEQAETLARQAKELAEREARVAEAEKTQPAPEPAPAAQPAPAPAAQPAPAPPPTMGAARQAPASTGGYGLFRAPPAQQQQEPPAQPAPAPAVDFADYVALEGDVDLLDSYLNTMLQTPEPAFGTDTARQIAADVRACIERSRAQAAALIS